MRFDESFLRDRAAKQLDWASKGKRTGSGKPFVPMAVAPAIGAASKSKGKASKPRPANPHAIALAALARNPELRTGGVVNGKKVSASHEHWEQVIIFDLIFRRFNEYYDDFAAVPNGGLRSKKTAVDIYAEGGKSGYPDITGDVPKGIYHGIFIELKYGNNKPSDDQIRMMRRRKERGYFVALCYGHEEAIELIAEYLALEAGGIVQWNKNIKLWECEA